MTDQTTWGAPLTGEQMKALRDAGLPDGTRVKNGNHGHDWAIEDLSLSFDDYRLPADHTAYTVIKAGWLDRPNVRLWFGGDEAPSDWDGGKTLLRFGAEGVGDRWQHYDACDIIAYIAKADVTETPVDDHQSILMSNNDQETVTIAKMTKAEVHARFDEEFLDERWAIIRGLKQLGLIKPEPTREDRFWQGKERNSLYHDEAARKLIASALNFERD